MIFDLSQYIWRAITYYIKYKSTEKKYDKHQLTDEDISDVQLPNYIRVGSWIFFGLKVISIVVAYYYIYVFIIRVL